MTRPPFLCERCGEQLDTINITNFGDQEPHYIPVPCECPRPRCPFCHTAIDHRTQCLNLDCFMVGQIIPEPEVA